jgi:hypothetical protein
MTRLLTHTCMTRLAFQDWHRHFKRDLYYITKERIVSSFPITLLSHYHDHRWRKLNQRQIPKLIGQRRTYYWLVYVSIKMHVVFSMYSGWTWWSRYSLTIVLIPHKHIIWWGSCCSNFSFLYVVFCRTLCFFFF